MIPPTLERFVGIIVLARERRSRVPVRSRDASRETHGGGGGGDEEDVPIQPPRIYLVGLCCGNPGWFLRLANIYDLWSREEETGAIGEMRTSRRESIVRRSKTPFLANVPIYPAHPLRYLSIPARVTRTRACLVAEAAVRFRLKARCCIACKFVRENRANFGNHRAGMIPMPARRRGREKPPPESPSSRSANVGATRSGYLQLLGMERRTRGAAPRCAESPGAASEEEVTMIYIRCYQSCSQPAIIPIIIIA